MTKGTLVFLTGSLLLLVPYLGIPQLWKQYSYIGIGVLLMIIGYIIRRAQFLADIDRGNGERGTDTFVETTQDLFSASKVE